MRGTVKTNDIETGKYLVQIVDIEETTGEFGLQLKWSFEIVAGDNTGKRLSAWSSQAMTTKSKLVKWASAILRTTPDQLDELDTDDLIGQRVVAVVVETAGKTGDLFAKIDSLQPYTPKAAPTPAAPPAPPTGKPGAAPTKPGKPAPLAPAAPDYDVPDTEAPFDPFADDV